MRGKKGKREVGAGEILEIPENCKSKKMRFRKANLSCFDQRLSTADEIRDALSIVPSKKIGIATSISERTTISYPDQTQTDQSSRIRRYRRLRTPANDTCKTEELIRHDDERLARCCCRQTRKLSLKLVLRKYNPESGIKIRELVPER